MTVIGYYIHHQGHGHLHRAIAIQAASAHVVTGLSTLARPAGWRGPWVQLTDDATPTPRGDRTAGNALHYAPVLHPGLRTRMATIAAWIDEYRPDAMVVDVSVEVALLARLHGVPVITMALPGHRRDDAHTLGYRVSNAIIAPWPPGGAAAWDVENQLRTMLVEVGAISRYAPAVGQPQRQHRRVVVLNGTGGDGADRAQLAAAQEVTPDWEWLILDRTHGTWLDNPWPALCSASVIISHCGQNAVAEIAAARRPAILLAQARPFDEQQHTARRLRSMTGMPAVVLRSWPAATDVAQLLVRAEGLDGTQWSRWNDGAGAARAAAVIDSVIAAENVEVPA